MKFDKFLKMRKSDRQIFSSPPKLAQTSFFGTSTHKTSTKNSSKMHVQARLQIPKLTTSKTQVFKF